MAQKTKSKSSKVKLKVAAKKVKVASKAKPKPKQEPKIGKYKLTVAIGGETFETQTNDLKKSILDLKPAKITNKVIVRVEEGKKFIEKILFVFPARRVFNNSVAAEYFVKNILLSLK
jgi:trehalose/maltose hydrolase-like predicted phosphorylase